MILWEQFTKRYTLPLIILLIGELVKKKNPFFHDNIINKPFIWSRTFEKECTFKTKTTAFFAVLIFEYVCTFARTSMICPCLFNASTAVVDQMSTPSLRNRCMIRPRQPGWLAFDRINVNKECHENVVTGKKEKEKGNGSLWTTPNPTLQANYTSTCLKQPGPLSWVASSSRRCTLANHFEHDVIQAYFASYTNIATYSAQKTSLEKVLRQRQPEEECI